MLYRLNLKEDAYSTEHVNELIDCIRSSISGYVDAVEDIAADKTFKVVLDSAKNQKITVGITDEHDKYGMAPLEFNIYIDGEEFGPMCYSSIERATMDMKDLILSKANKKFVESYTDTSEETPYTYRQVFDELKLETRGFTIPGDTICYYYESEAKHAMKILARHYNKVTSKQSGNCIEITFKNVAKETNESLRPITDYIVGDRDNQQYIGNAQIIKASQLPKIGEKFKAGICTSISKVGYEDGYIIYAVGVTEPESLDGFAEFDYDTANWLFAIKNFTEGLERDDNSELSLTEFTYKIDDLKDFYKTATGIDRQKYPNFFIWYDEMKKQGKFKQQQNAFA
jgi:hypothetical protein